MIEIQQLCKSYGARRGVHGLNFTVPEGSMFGFIGPNGAGKTTVIRLLLGFLRPDLGRATIFGLDCWRDSHRIKADVGYVPGDLRLPSWLHGRNALAIVGATRGTNLRAAGESLAQQFDLDLTVRVRAMSRGMRQKLGLILALVHEPRLLVLDEPTTGLDPLTQDLLYEHLRATTRRGATVFFSSHVLSEVQDLCDRVAIIRRGDLVANATLAELRAQAQRAVTLRWREDPGTPPPDFLELDVKTDQLWKGGLSGPTPQLVEWLQGRPVEDVSIAVPDLDGVFRRFYRDDDQHSEDPQDRNPQDEPASTGDSP